MILEFFILTIILILNLLILFGITNVRSKNNRKQRYLFVGIIIWIIIWVISILITDISYKNTIISLWASRVSFSSIAFLSIFYTLFAASFNKLSTKIERFFIFLFIAVSVIAIIIPFTELIIKSTTVIEGKKLRSEFGVLYYLYAVYILFSFTYSSLLLFYSYRKEKSISLKMQILYIFIGSVLSITFSFITNLLLPILRVGEIRYLGPLSLIFFLAFTYYSIIRYRFMSIKFVVGRSLYFFILATFIFITFHTVYFIQTLIWESIFDIGALISGGIIAIFYIFIFQKVDEIIRKLFEKLLIYSEYDPVETINKVQNIISRGQDIEKIVVKVLELTKKSLNSSKAGLLFVEKGKVLYKNLNDFNSKEFVEKDTFSNIVKHFKFIKTDSKKKNAIVYDEIIHQIPSRNDKEFDYLKKIQKFMKKEKVVVLFPLYCKDKLYGCLFTGKKDKQEAYTVQDIVFLEGIAVRLAKIVRKFVVTYEDVNLALKSFSTPNLLQENNLLGLKQVIKLTDEKGISEVNALKEVISSAIEYFKPADKKAKRTSARLKYEILRMIAYEGAIESQLMWDLGFDAYTRSVEEKLREQREPRFKFKDASEYSATSSRSFKRLKKEAIEMLKWRLVS